MKIGLFGGSFDPVHCGHMQIALGALRQFALNRVVWVPARISPFKRDAEMQASPENRFEMVKIACSDIPQFEVSDCEIKRPGLSYAVDTLRIMKSDYPTARFYWILGEDSFASLSLWHRSEELIRELTFLVARRNGRADFSFEAGKAEMIQTERHPAASTEIKKNLSAGRGWEHLDPRVSDYIRHNGLYGVRA